MRLNDLVQSTDIRFTMPIESLIVRAITDSSREVRDGSVFVALRGSVQDGHNFIPDACKRGACAIIAEEIVKNVDPGIPIGITKNTRKTYAQILQTFYGYPSRQVGVIGITGTNGKTTTSFLLRHILGARHKVGLIGTIHALVETMPIELNNTTPDLAIINKLLADMQQKECAYCVMEVSSHALDQKRIESTEFIARIFTNLTQDHLDYHPSMEAYYESKKRLFTEYSSDALSVINIDDPYGQRLLNEIGGKKISYSCKTAADVSASKIKAGLDSLNFIVQVLGERTEVEVPLACLHNVYNVLAAIATAVALGQPLKEITEKLVTFPGVKGRMERVPGTGEVPIFVDYAHTPDAFLNVLKAVRELHKGKIITVFGCGGDRDRDKRPKMGALAVRFSDHVYITCDNPRTEDPQRIIDDICKGISPQDLEKKCRVITHRQEAIEEACRTAEHDAIILILGKGHEEYQIIGKQKNFFSDQQVVAEWMKRKNALNSECR